MKNIVIIGGGTGTYTLLSGLKNYQADLSVIVSTADDGGSTGKLRKDLGVLPPGDIRQCLLGLSEARESLKQLFSFRFGRGSLSGHNVGNIILAVLEKNLGVDAAIAVCGDLLQAKGQVLPVTLKPTVLSAIYQNGHKVVGEHNIDEISSKNQVVRIKGLQLKSPVLANSKVIKAIKGADAIVFGPGDLYTSILPNLLVKGVKEAIGKSSAKKIYITNLMTKHGQTDGFKASDFVREISRYLGKAKLDAVLVNDQKPSLEWLKKYGKEKAEFVWPDISEIASLNIKVVADNLLADYVFFRQSGDKLTRSFLRHSPQKAAKIIWELIK
jgi:uncharacterized cofD-like protein